MTSSSEIAACASCGKAQPASLLHCPSCGALVHAAKLNELAATARAAEGSGRFEDALAAWRTAHDLVPPSSRQAEEVKRLIDAAAARVHASPSPGAIAPTTTMAAKGTLGRLLIGGALLAWKAKWLLAFVLTKGKIVLFGLTKVSTLASMVLSVGVYAALFGFWFAFGIVLSIYIHEMGHIVAMRARGIAAEPPMFIPGLGAFIRQKSRPTDAVEDATIGLAGPIAGAAASLLCIALFYAFDAPMFAALAKVGAWINLFNLLPLFSLDGGRAFRALSTIQRWVVAAACGALLFATSEGMVVLVLIGVAIRIFGKGDAPKVGHPRTLVMFLVLLAVLAPLAASPVPGAPTDDAPAPPTTAPGVDAPG